ncbi:MAG: Ig-like domain-containing protein, partial [bacterium]|nr:Ig-like domain-containing protein [bacterium]
GANTGTAPSATGTVVDANVPKVTAQLDPASDSGIVGDGITNDNTPTISGTGEPGASITVNIGGQSLTTTVNSNGDWSATPSVPLADGSYTAQITETIAGKTATTTVPITIDTTSNVTAQLDPASDSGIVGDGITTDNTPTISGTGEPGASITVNIGGQSLTTTVDSDGNWSVTPTTPLADGPYTAQVTAKDAAGNTAATTVPITIDTTSAVTAQLDPSSDSGVVGDGITTDNTPTISGTGEPGASITVNIGGQTLTTTVDSDGNWSVTTTILPTGQYPVRITATDAAGNTAISTLNITIVAEQQKPIGPKPQPGIATPQPVSPVQADPARAPFGSTGLHVLNSSMSAAGQGAGMGFLAGRGQRDGLLAPELEEPSTPRALSPDTTLNLDEGLDQLLGTEIRQYIHDTVNHTWERVERWYGTGTPGTEMLRYDALGGAQDPFNGFSGPMDAKMLEELNRVLNSILDGEALTGGGESGLSPVLAESRTLQNQLSRADNLNRDIERLSRIFAEEK